MFRRLRAAWMRLLALFGSSRADRELADEIESHLQLHADDNIRAGMDPSVARRHAIIVLGGVDQTKERYRDRRSVIAIEQLLYDLRLAIRALARRRLLLTAAVISIAVGVGANVAVYTVLQRLLFSSRWLAATDADRLVTIFPGLSYPNFRDIRESETTVDLAAFTLSRAIWRTPDLSASVSVHAVSDNFFEMLGTRAFRGQLFTAPRPGAPVDPHRMLLGYGFWQRLGGNDAIVGQPVTLNGWSYTIVGVLPPDFHLAVGPMISSGIYVPISPAIAMALDRRDASYFDIIGRLRSGVTFPQAAASLKRTAEGLANLAENAELARRLEVRRGAVSPMQSLLAAPQGRFVMPLAAVAYTLVGLVLLIACANVAGLLTARADERRHETGVRTALGASRGRLIQQFLAESLVVAVLGSVAAAIVWSVTAAILPRLVVFDPSTEFVVPRMPFVYSALLAVVVAIACGLAPAIVATHAVPLVALRAGRLGHIVRGLRLQSILVSGQVALSFVLLTAAFVLLHTFLLLRVVDPGYDIVHTAAVQLTPLTTAPIAAADLKTAVDSFAGMVSSSYGELPLSGAGILSRSARVHLANVDSAVASDLFFAGPRFLETMGIPIDRGRDLNEQDLQAGGISGTIVNETFVRRYLAQRDAIGEEIVVEGDRENGRPDRRLRIVGVARDTRIRSLADEGVPVVFLPRPSLTIVVRLRDTAASQARALERATADRFPGSLVTVTPTGAAVRTALLPSQVAAALLSGLGAIGLTLAMIGLHGIVSYGVTRRSFEIGVRIALGATRLSVVRMILRSALRVVAVGAAIGLVASLMVVQALRPFLAAGQRALDPVAIAGVAFTLIAAGAMASLWPARRAAGVDPTVALRSE